MLLSVAPRLIWISFFRGLCWSCEERNTVQGPLVFSTNVLSLPFSCWQSCRVGSWSIFSLKSSLKTLWLLKRFYLLLVTPIVIKISSETQHNSL